MAKKKMVLILILVFVLLLGGAYVLYKQLEPSLAPDQLAAQTTNAADDQNVGRERRLNLFVKHISAAEQQDKHQNKN